MNSGASPEMLRIITFLGRVHERIHPRFADGLLPQIRASKPLPDPKAFTALEIVFLPDGTLSDVRTRSESGLVALDSAAVEAVRAASPFSAPPAVLLAPDGRAHLHWEFHVDETLSCSPASARFLDEKGNVWNPPPLLGAGSSQKN